MEIRMIPCPVCGCMMPEIRKTKFGYNFCIKCSNVGIKRGIPVQMGEGDHTWVETIIIEENDFLKFHNPNIQLGIDNEFEEDEIQSDTP